MSKREHWSTWFRGSEQDWRALTSEQRETASFDATGCDVAWPTWPAPAGCVHGTCRVRRGECHPMTLVNGTLRYESESGWLRFCGRERRARVYRAVRAHCRATGVYDAWKAWPLIVYGGLEG